MFSNKDLSTHPFNNNYVPLMCNYSKECNENNKIYNRSLPIDNISKNIIIPPRPLSTSKCNLEEYNKQCYLFPPKTEVLISKNENLDEKICQQNFVNIDDESYLKNIVVPLSKNRHNKNFSKKLNYNMFEEEEEEEEEELNCLNVNVSTKRKLIHF